MEFMNLVVTTAPLLSGGLRECATYDENYDDDANDEHLNVDSTYNTTTTTTKPCSTGGVAAVQALVRHYNMHYNKNNNSNNTNNNTSNHGNSDEKNGEDDHDQPVLVVPMGDFQDPLTLLSRFQYGVNVLIYHKELQWRTWVVPAYTLWPNRFTASSVSDAQEPLYPVTVTNAVSSPVDTWFPYIRQIYWDDPTHIALLFITRERESNVGTQVSAAQNLLQYVAKTNSAKRCSWRASSDTTEATIDLPGISALSAFQDVTFRDWYQLNKGNLGLPDNSTRPTLNNTALSNCYTPVIVFDDMNTTMFNAFLEAFNSSSSESQVPFHHLPHVIVDIFGSYQAQSGKSIDRINNGIGTWLVSYVDSSTQYNQLRFERSNATGYIENVTILTADLERLPKEALTADHYQTLDNLRLYAREALETSLITEPGVPTLAMPASQDSNSDGIYRHCYVGECAIGNLCADALRWFENQSPTAAPADIAVLPSFMFGGPGWPAGEIRTLEILENVPVATQRCGVTMTGLSFYRLMQNAIETASFDGYSNTSAVGGRLLQVSGMRYTYYLNHTLLDDDNVFHNKIVSIDVWDRELGDYRALERTRLYRVVTCNHLCSTFSTFPSYVGPELLVEKGEVSGEKLSEIDFRDDIRDYLRQVFGNTSTPFRPAIDEGRVRQDTNSTRAANAFGDYGQEDWCIQGRSYWSSSLKCEPCPYFNGVVLSKERTALNGVSFSSKLLLDELMLTNTEWFPIWVRPVSLSLPRNIELNISTTGTSTRIHNNNESQYLLASNESISITIAFNCSDRIAGTDTSSLLFEIINADTATGQSTGCPDFRMKYDIVAQLALSSQRNHLGGVVAFGYTSVGLISITAIVFALLVHWRRTTAVVRTMQPVFLMTLCLGLFVLGLVLIPMSIDDGVASDHACDMACMARPWLISTGFSISVTALFSKLWRINKLFSSGPFRRVQVREQDVILPNTILVSLTLTMMLIWTLADPLHWERVVVKDQPWNSYGKCSFGDKIIGQVMLCGVIALSAVGFLMTCWQAYKARNISSTYSESKYLGIAIFSWVQLIVVGTPVMYLMQEDNTVALYSLGVGLILAVCMSMLLVIFVPIFMVAKNDASPGGPVDRSQTYPWIRSLALGKRSQADAGDAAREHGNDHSNYRSASVVPGMSAETKSQEERVVEVEGQVTRQPEHRPEPSHTLGPIKNNTTNSDTTLALHV